MAKIIEFPTKYNFINGFKGKIPDDILDNLSEAYDRVTQLSKMTPSIDLEDFAEIEGSVKRLNQEYTGFILTLLKRILELEAEVCLLKRSKPTE